MAATAQESVCSGIGLTSAQNNGCKDNADSPTLTSVIHTVINILSYLIGIAAIIMILVGGFKYITAGGESNKITSAKNAIVFALIGLVIASLAQILVRFVLTRTATSTLRETPSSGCDIRLGCKS